MGSSWCSLLKSLCGVRGRCPALRATAIAECCSHEGVYLIHNSWVVCVKWHPDECQDPIIPCRALHCNEMIKVIHIRSLIGVSSKLILTQTTLFSYSQQVAFLSKLHQTASIRRRFRTPVAGRLRLSCYFLNGDICCFGKSFSTRICWKYQYAPKNKNKHGNPLWAR